MLIILLLFLKEFIGDHHLLGLGTACAPFARVGHLRTVSGPEEREYSREGSSRSRTRRVRMLGTAILFLKWRTLTYSFGVGPAAKALCQLSAETLSPKRSPALTMTSPTWRPIRYRALLRSSRCCRLRRFALIAQRC